MEHIQVHVTGNLIARQVSSSLKASLNLPAGEARSSGSSDRENLVSKTSSFAKTQGESLYTVACNYSVREKK